MPKRSQLPPTPREVNRLVLDIRRLAMVVRTEYEWTYGATVQGRKGESAHVKVSDPNDSTSSAALGEQRAKRELVRAGAMLEQAMENLRLVEYILGNILGWFDPVPRPEPLRYPRTESRQDLVEHAEAKERREGRGESYGEG